MLKNITKNMRGANYFFAPPPSMKYDNIFERYLLSGDIQNEIIQLYKTELLNILLIYILMELSRLNVMEFRIYTEVRRILWRLVI